MSHQQSPRLGQSHVAMAQVVFWSVQTGFASVCWHCAVADLCPYKPKTPAPAG